MPAGAETLMLRSSAALLDLDARTVTGATLRDLSSPAPRRCRGRTSIRPRDNPIKPVGAHGGAARQPGAARRGDQAFGGDAKLLQHTGRAVVFDSVEDMTLRVDDPRSRRDADDVLVLRNAGPKGAPGMPEAGYLPIPKKLARPASRTWCGYPMRA
jgi:dihydroxy-acid dehydratase